MNSKPYILFLPKWYPCRNTPLVGIFVKKHAKAVSEFIDVCVLYVVYDAGLTKQLIEKVETREEGILTLRYYYKKNITGLPFIDKLFKLGLYFWCSWIGYKRICQIQGKKPILNHVHVFLRPAVFAWVLQFLYGIKYVVTEHWSGYMAIRNEYKGFFRKKITSWIAGKASAIMPVSEVLKKAMEAHQIHGRYIIIPNVIDTDKFYPVASSVVNNKINILFVGDIINRVKNVLGMLHVIKRIRSERHDFVFNIVGEGEDKEKNITYAQSNNLMDCVQFLGYVANSQMPEYYNNCSFFMMFSHFETQPTVLLEAMACGKPVISTDVGGVSELVNKFNGTMVKPNDEEDLYNKLNFMLNHYLDFDKGMIRNFVEKSFSNKEVGEKFYNAYNTIVSD